jgi:hypothetical protein
MLCKERDLVEGNVCREAAAESTFVHSCVVLLVAVVMVAVLLVAVVIECRVVAFDSEICEIPHDTL